MKLSSVAVRLQRADFQYVFGRFQTVRSAYGLYRRAFDPLTPTPESASGAGASSHSLFKNVSTERIVKAIREEAVYVGLTLPQNIVSEIKEFALTEPLHAIYDPNGPEFRHADVSNGICKDGRRMPIGGVRDPARCDAVKAVVNDPGLRQIVKQYLGHEPRKIVTILDWSFGSSMSDEERRKLKHGVIDYHYDVGGLNFVYASFYITDTDRHSGAHVMMKRSHNKKPLRMLIGSARASQDAVYQEFGAENEITIEGPAGTGFVQDTSCYHRASPPTRGDRLMLAVRFIN
jgi:hypothetical protein